MAKPKAKPKRRGVPLIDLCRAQKPTEALSVIYRSKRKGSILYARLGDGPVVATTTRRGLR